MRPDKHIWIVLADGAQARFFTPSDALQHLVPARPDLYSKRAHRRTGELLSDAAGRVAGSAGSAVRHAVEPHHDAQKLEKHKFAVALARVLDEACAQRAFDHVVLAAAPRTLGELRSLLSAPVKARLAGELGKDLIKTPVGELWAHVGSLVERAAAGYAQ
jgi:protein required for attachment to host cells